MAFVKLALTLARTAERLARVTAADDVNGFDVGPVNFSNVSIARHLRPVFRENSARVRVNLALPSDPHAGALKPQIEAANASEQRTDFQLFNHVNPMSVRCRRCDGDGLHRE